MDDKCNYCKKKIKTRDKFVLIGSYPTINRRFLCGNLLWYELGYLGTMYHKNCFYEKITKRDKKKAGGTKVEKE